MIFGKPKAEIKNYPNLYLILRSHPSPWACHLAVVVELACLSDPKSYVGGDLVPGGFNRAGLVEG